MTELITPAKAHDNQYPKPMPNLENTTNSIPPILGYFSLPNDINATELTAGKGHYIHIKNAIKQPTTLNLTFSNFNPSTGLLAIEISSEVETTIQLNLVTKANETSSVLQLETLTVTAGQPHIFVFALYKQNDDYKLVKLVA